MAREPTKTTRARKPAAAKGTTTTGHTPAKKPATANKPKTTKAPAPTPAKAKRASPRSNTRKAVDTAANLKTAESTAPKKAKPLPAPDVPDTESAMNAELLELDAANMVGDDWPDAPAPDSKFSFLDSATPLITSPTMGLKGILTVAVMSAAVGALLAGAWAYGSALDKGWQQGQTAAYLNTSIAAMQNYLQCTDEPPACAGQQATATWTKEYTDGKLAELEAED